MKVTVKKNTTVPTDVEYPRLMVCKEDLEDSCNCKNPLIVLFANKTQGIVISGHNCDEFRDAEFEGDFDWTYSDYHFVPFIGELTLSSDGT